MLAGCRDFTRRPNEHSQRRQAFGQAIGIGIQAQHCLEPCEADLVEAQCPLQRVAGEPRDQIRAADDEPRLRSAEQFVAAEGNKIGSLRQRLSRGRLVRQAPAAEIDQRPAAEIFDKGYFMLASECGEICRSGGGGKALDRIVAGMRLEDQPGLRPDRGCKVGEMGAVGGPDLTQPGAGGKARQPCSRS